MPKIIHGRAHTRDYYAWQGMKARCHNPAHISYPRYGGRGINVCDRWRQSFAAFVEDMGERPPGCLIERIDNNGNYEPGNCRWATRPEQSNNKTNNRIVEWRGAEMSFADFVRASGTSLPPNTVLSRLNRGASPDEAIQGV